MGRAKNKSVAGAVSRTANVGGEIKKPSRKSTQKKKRTPSPAQVERIKRTEEKIKKLDQTIAEMTPENYQNWLKKLPQLHNYSLKNYQLILMEAQYQGFCPTRVASMRAWNKLGRKIKKGERGLPIQMPFGIETIKKDSKTGELEKDENGDVVKKSIKRFKPYFGIFDITQTELLPVKDGEEAPVDKTRQGAFQCQEEMVRVAESFNISVHLGGVDEPDFPQKGLLNTLLLNTPNAGGYFLETKATSSEEAKRYIVTRKGLSDNEQARVIAHELGHAILHSQAVNKTEDGAKLSAQQKEIEAESVSYVLCSDYGVETDYSAAYIMNWMSAEGKDDREKSQLISKSSNRIRDAVKDIYSVLDDLE